MHTAALNRAAFFYFLMSKKKPKTEEQKRIDRERSRATRARNRAFVESQLRPCDHCQAFDKRFMEWHHIDPSTKLREVSDMAGCCGSIQKIREEIDKCNCLCANCHAIVHYGEQLGNTKRKYD